MSAYFSIIIPTLNEEGHLPHLLTDLSKQTFKDFEVIVVDAKSKDKTKSIAKKFDKLSSKIKVITSERKNVSYQRNLGSKNSNADWVVFMDADTRIPKSYFKYLKSYSEKYNPDILSTWLKPDTNNKQDKIFATIMNLFMDFSKNSTNPRIMEAMLLVKKYSFNKLKGFDVKIPWQEGGDLLTRGKKMGLKFVYLKTPKYTYSFRRIKKSGAYKVLQDIVRMEVAKILKGKLSMKKAKKLYPMEGGKFYDGNQEPTSKLQKFLSEIFQDKFINKKSVRLFEKRLNSWKSFFR